MPKPVLGIAWPEVAAVVPVAVEDVVAEAVALEATVEAGADAAALAVVPAAELLATVGAPVVAGTLRTPHPAASRSPPATKPVRSRVLGDPGLSMLVPPLSPYRLSTVEART